MKPWIPPIFCLLLPSIDLLHRNIEALSNIFHGLAGGWNDAYTLGNSLSSDWVIASDHDNLRKGQALRVSDKCICDGWKEISWNIYCSIPGSSLESELGRLCYVRNKDRLWLLISSVLISVLHFLLFVLFYQGCKRKTCHEQQGWNDAQ